MRLAKQLLQLAAKGLKPSGIFCIPPFTYLNKFIFFRFIQSFQVGALLTHAGHTHRRLLLREANKSLIKFVLFVRTKMEIMGFKTIDIKNKKGFQAIRIPKQMQIDDDKVYKRN